MEVRKIMSKFSDNLKNLRKEINYTQEQLAKALNVTKSRINMYERGEREPNFEMLENIADYFNVDMNYLLGKTDIKNSNKHCLEIQKYKNIHPIELKKFPLLGEIACGEPVFCVENRESYVLAGADIKADFCLKAKGDSMINARILDGDIVFIRKQPSVENGEIAAVIVDDEATLKRVYYDKSNNYLQLIAENPKYSPMVYTNEQLETIRILGKAIAFQSDVK